MGIFSWLVSSGDDKYVVTEYSSGDCTVRRNDGFFRSTGTKIGSTDSFGHALDVIKSDSNSDDVLIK